MRRVFPAALCVIALGMTVPITVSAAQASEPDAESVLSTLTVVPQHNIAGYNRTEFAYNTVDTDHDGCRTRDDVLARDLDNVERRGCTVESGSLRDPYTGGTIAFVRGRQTSSAVQIDHIVALHDAWNDGASTWSKQQLESFGNDQFNLAAVDGPANQQKGDQSADEWEPSNTVAQCPYVAQQIAVKRKYSLGVTANERNAMKRVLNTCEGYPLPSEGTSLVRAVIARGGSQPSGHPFVDTGTISSRGERYEFRGMSDVLRQDMAAFLYRLAGKPASPESSNTWIYDRYVDVNGSTPHCHDIYWLTLKGISEGWVYTPPQPPATPSKPSQPSQPAKPSQPSNPPATVYYKNCTEVREAGKAPLHRGDPGYRSALDRDDDGIACETKR